MLERLIGEDIVVRLDLADALPAVLADRTKLEQVLLNVAANARDAMPHGGRFAMATSLAQAEEVASLTGAVVPPGAYVKLAMSDSGIGMDADTKQRLFEPFFTTKELGKGTGLGLATVYGIVKQLHGYIVVSSEVGHGTSFLVYFPASDGTRQSDPVTPSRKAVTSLAANREVVLLVEDESGVRNFVARTLKRHGYHVLEAGSAQDGLRLATDYKASIDLILSDVIMPLMSGPEMVKRLLEVRPAVKVLYMSGQAGPAAPENGRLDASTHLIEKPFAAHDLLRAVRARLDMA
jgi:CheY-like chemotaxis protein